MVKLFTKFKSNYDFDREAWIYIVSMSFVYLALTAFYNVLLLIYYKKLGMGEDFIGNIIALRTIITGLGAIPTGMLVGKLGRRNTIIAGMTLTAIGFIGLSCWVNPALICFSAILNGMGTSIIYVNEAPLLAEKSKAGSAMNIYSINSLLQMLAAVIGSKAAGFIPKFMQGSIVVSLRNTQLIFVVLIFLSIIPILTLKNYKVKYERKSFGNLMSYLKTPKLGGIILYQVLINCAAGLIGAFFSIYLKFKLNSTTNVVGTVQAISQIAIAVGILTVPYIVKRYGKAFTVQVCQILAIPALLTISLSWSITIVGICYCLRSCLMNMTTPVVQNLSMEMVPEKERMAFNSILQLLVYVGRAAGIVVGGIIMKYVNYDVPYYITAAIYIVAIFVFSAVFTNSTKKSLGESCS